MPTCSDGRAIVATAAPFDPATSTRRFTLGAPDGVSAVVLPPLLTALRENAPGIAIGLLQLAPVPGETVIERAWHATFARLEARAMDVALVPVEQIPARFERAVLHEDDFVVAMRDGHLLAAHPTLERYCAMQHVVVSLTGDPYGFVDSALAAIGRSPRVALTVPNFMFALAMLAEADLVAALPRSFVAQHAARFGVVWREQPIPLECFRLSAVAPRAAMMDQGVAWLFDTLRARMRSAAALEPGGGAPDPLRR